MHFLLCLSVVFFRLLSVLLWQSSWWIPWGEWDGSDEGFPNIPLPATSSSNVKAAGAQGGTLKQGHPARSVEGGKWKSPEISGCQQLYSWLTLKMGTSKIFVFNVYLQEILNSTSLVNIHKCLNELLVNLKWQWWVRMSVRWYGTAWALPIKGINLTEGGGEIPLLMAPLIFVHFE